MDKKTIKTYRDLNVYKQSFDLAMKLFNLSTKFPQEERYGLVDQIRRSSRSVPANIAEGWAKRHFENVFKRHLVDAMGSCEEVNVWLEFALECNYINLKLQEEFLRQNNEIGKMLYSLHKNWKTEF